MAPNFILKSFRFARVFCRDGQPMEGLASHFGLEKQLYSTRVISPAGQDDCTVSYLVNSCGLSLEAATLVSHKVKLQTLDKPNSVLALLRDYEFSDTHISTLVRRQPRILVADAQKTLLPKLEFLSSIGMSRLDLANKLSHDPWVMSRSLENLIIPMCSFLKSVVLSDDKLVYILKHNLYIFSGNLSKNVIPNVELVRKLGMPQSCIVLLLTSIIVLRESELFNQLVAEVEQWGFDPRKSSFVLAMNALCRKETTWKRCDQAYRRWGWSDNDIVAAFRMDPLCMILSEKKIMATMDFFVNKMGWQSHTVAKYPHVLSYSLEKKIIPRLSVVRVLVLKGLIEEHKLNLGSVISVSEEYFLNRFVNKYPNQVPQLLDVYQGKVASF
ncbi:hypothetical protein ACLB2K_067624 [Fragaria x ananassa]